MQFVQYSFVQFPTLLLLLIFSSWAHAAPGSTATSTDIVETTPLPDNSDTHIRFAFSGGMGFGIAEFGERTAVLPAPDSASYRSLPYSGTYRPQSLLSFRTVESVLFPMGSTRDLVLGAGLDVLTQLSSEHSYESDKSIPIDLQLLSLAFEGGVRKKIGSWQSVEILGGIDVGVFGKTSFSYLSKGETNISKEYTIEDRIGLASFRLGLRARYLVHCWSFLSLGTELDGSFSKLSVASRKTGIWAQTTTVRGVLSVDID